MLNAAAFDILADAGLGYESGCVESLRAQWNDDTSKCKDALGAAFDSTNAVFAGQHPIAHVLLTLLGYLIPPLSSSSIFARNRAIKTNRKRMEKLGLKMIEDRQSSSDEELVASGHIDIVSRLIFAAGRRLGIAAKSDKDVLVAQINAFLFAGHEITASTLSWLILSLTHHQAFQIRLARNIEHLHLDQAASDPIIEATAKEVLRLYPASRVLRRVADSEVILPLSEPLRGNQNGEDGKNPGDPRKLVVPKGQNIVIGLAAMNRIKSIWGEDADEFNPYYEFGESMSLTCGLERSGVISMADLGLTAEERRAVALATAIRDAERRDKDAAADKIAIPRFKHNPDRIDTTVRPWPGAPYALPRDVVELFKRGHQPPLIWLTVEGILDAGRRRQQLTFPLDKKGLDEVNEALARDAFLPRAPFLSAMGALAALFRAFQVVEEVAEEEQDSATLIDELSLAVAARAPEEHWTLWL
ncbi:hypothetical protein CF319_g7889 [Tilletia indica]|nr:hypothetical protein CF319_g7889 [Tilletia indica]